MNSVAGLTVGAWDVNVTGTGIDRNTESELKANLKAPLT